MTRPAAESSGSDYGRLGALVDQVVEAYIEALMVHMGWVKHGNGWRYPGGGPGAEVGPPGTQVGPTGDQGIQDMWEASWRGTGDYIHSLFAPLVDTMPDPAHYDADIRTLLNTTQELTFDVAGTGAGIPVEGNPRTERLVDGLKRTTGRARADGLAIDRFHRQFSEQLDDVLPWNAAVAGYAFSALVAEQALWDQARAAAVSLAKTAIAEFYAFVPSAPAHPQAEGILSIANVVTTVLGLFAPGAVGFTADVANFPVGWGLAALDEANQAKAERDHAGQQLQGTTPDAMLASLAGQVQELIGQIRTEEGEVEAHVRTMQELNNSNPDKLTFRPTSLDEPSAADRGIRLNWAELRAAGSQTMPAIADVVRGAAGGLSGLDQGAWTRGGGLGTGVVGPFLQLQATCGLIQDRLVDGARTIRDAGDRLVDFARMMQDLDGDVSAGLDGTRGSLSDAAR